MSRYDYASLRPLDFRPLTYQGQHGFFVRDPLDLATQQIWVPQYLGPVLMACNGERTLTQMQMVIQMQYGLSFSAAEIERFLEQLDEICLLDNERAAAAKAKALADYRSAPFREPASAGLSYPAEAAALRQQLQGYMDAIPETTELLAGHGLISPHIDYQRGGPVYAQVWKRMAHLARAADCVIFLGTDHNGLSGQITLTRQDYATPFGTLPTDQAVVQAIAAALGEEAVFEAELHHRKEHAIELAAVWLHFIRDGQPCPIVPILCGSFHHFINNGKRPAEDERLKALVETIKQATAGRKTLYVAAGDLAHLGPAFGGPPVDPAGKSRLARDDEALLAPVSVGDADGFFEIIRRERGERNICGTSSIYLALKMMGSVAGETVSYDRCLADEDGTSFVSVCGVAFT